MLNLSTNQTKELKYRAYESYEKGLRRVVLWMNVRVMPYVRQTWTTRWSYSKASERVREYNENQGAIRDAVVMVMRKEGIRPLI